MRPWLSVAGTRCTRCTPDSNFSRANTLRPVISAMPSFSAAQLGVAVFQDLEPPAAKLGVFLVHREQLSGEQPGLVTARRGADFQNGATARPPHPSAAAQGGFRAPTPGCGPSGRRSSASARSRISGSRQQRLGFRRERSAARRSPMRATTGSISDSSFDALDVGLAGDPSDNIARSSSARAAMRSSLNARLMRSRAAMSASGNRLLRRRSPDPSPAPRRWRCRPRRGSPRRGRRSGWPAPSGACRLPR